MIERSNKCFIFLLLSILLLGGCSKQQTASSSKRFKYPDNIAMIVSVSSDGNYAVSSHLNGELVLWDIRNKTNKIITNNANAYSAYFIKTSDKFMWQDNTSNEVYVEDVAGKIWLSFQPGSTLFVNGFPVYGQVMSSDLKHYFISEENSGFIYSGYGEHPKSITPDYSGFYKGILLNLILSNDNKLLLISHFSKDSRVDGVIVWDVETEQSLHKLVGNDAKKTIATLSPDGKYIVTGDNNGEAFVWNTYTGKKHLDVSLAFYNRPADFMNSQLPGEDDDDNDNKDNSSIGAVFALKFITDKEYLRFTLSANYAILYNVNDPHPLKYFRLTPQPLALNDNLAYNHALLSNARPPCVTDNCPRNRAMDTAPVAYILVTSQDVTDGINVYQYNPKTETLTEIWRASMHDTKTK